MGGEVREGPVEEQLVQALEVTVGGMGIHWKG